MGYIYVCVSHLKYFEKCVYIHFSIFLLGLRRTSQLPEQGDDAAAVAVLLLFML